MTEKIFRVVVIDPSAQTVEEAQWDGSLNDLHTLVGAPVLDNFRLADHEGSWDYGWCDDGGLSRGQPIHAFLFSIRKDPIAGRCLIIGVNKDTRDNCDAKFPLRVLRESIRWLGLIRPEVTWDKTETGSRAIVTYARVK